MYLNGRSIHVGVVTTDLMWEKTSKLCLPWYADIPELPTPPNGMFPLAMCMIVSLMQAPPEEVRARTFPPLRPK